MLMLLLMSHRVIFCNYDKLVNKQHLLLAKKKKSPNTFLCLPSPTFVGISLCLATLLSLSVAGQDELK